MQSTSQMYSGRTETFASCHRQKKKHIKVAVATLMAEEREM